MVLIHLGDVMRFLAIACILCNQIIEINSKTSILWKFNPNSGKIDGFTEDSDQHELEREIQEIYENDEVFSLITGDTSFQSRSYRHTDNFLRKVYQFNLNGSDDNSLECHPVSFSFYDDLIGVASRHNHPIMPDAEAIAFFIKNIETKSLHFFNIDTLEHQLRRSLQTRPPTVKIYNQLANYWRIKGDSGKSIDCFRSALILDPTNADALHDLSRVLYSLQYFDDAIFLARRSVESQANAPNKWRSYFTLGEIYRSYGQFQQSLLYFRRALELFPEHEPIAKAIKSLEDLSTVNLQHYTIVIITFLVLGVMGWIITNMSNCSVLPEQKTQRNFNRSLTMKTLKGFVPRTSKHRKV